VVSLPQLTEQIVTCRRCPRLVAWREQVAHEKRAAFRGDEYWGRPVPGFGDPAARLLIIGLAPAAHGGNRTGRVFTGDRSGDFLFASLHRGGFANQPTAHHRDDGLTLTDTYIAAVVRCAPPANRPSPTERDACLSYLVEEIGLLPRLRVAVCLGAFAWDGLLRTLRHRGHEPGRRPRFGHLAEAEVGPLTLIGCYHPSQQNTFTGRLTPAMIDAVWIRAASLIASPPGQTSSAMDDDPASLDARVVGRSGRR
jgi:uracil-DNA glycosylase family 4